MITTDKVAEFIDLLRQCLNSDSNLNDEFSTPLCVLMKNMVDNN